MDRSAWFWVYSAANAAVIVGLLGLVRYRAAFRRPGPKPWRAVLCWTAVVVVSIAMLGLAPRAARIEYEQHGWYYVIARWVKSAWQG